MYIEVAVPVPSLPALTYAVEDTMAPACGSRVMVPVGRKVLPGIVVAVGVTKPEKIRVKAVIKVLDQTPVLPPALLKLGQWMAGYYRCTWGEALHAMLPGAGLPKVRERYELINPDQAEVKKGQAALLLERLQNGPVDKAVLLEGLPASAARLLTSLEKEGLLQRTLSLSRKRAHHFNTVTDLSLEEPKSLSQDQQGALAPLLKAVDGNIFEGFLLFGVTGSGKTEVYLQAIAHVLAQGGGALLLVPEIALTTQMQERVKARFGGAVAVLHSGLTPKARLEAWMLLVQGQARVAIGARSAVFAPVKNLRLIVVDEEYETSYKQDDTPRYHARDVAAVRAREERATLVLGSATPSLETFHHAQEGKLTLLTLSQRIDHKTMPEVQLVDMTEVFDQARRFPLFSTALLDALADRLRKNEQSILFLNRRGFAPLVMCPACKHQLTCPDCSVALVYHLTHDKLHCHSCGRIFPARPACPKCGTACVKLVGAGTQRVEEELRHWFPDSRILRLDQDMTRKRGVLEKSLLAFKNQEADILVGTQMVAKGIDFEKVTLVGIITADTALNLPDFRAEERTFQLMVQVAGRAGRGGVPGLVIAQTHHADHDVLLMAAQHDYQAFFQREIETRRLLGYPPFMRLANIVCRSRAEGDAQKTAQAIANQARRVAGRQDQILGPAPSPYQRVAKESRFQVLLKSPTHQQRSRLVDAIQRVPIKSNVKIIIDIDPVNLL